MPGASIYQGRDPRELPAYTVAEASRYVSVPPATLRSWFSGRTYPKAGGIGSFKRILTPADSRGHLSFRNLVEAHVLRGLRTRHGIRIRTIREALKVAEEHLGIEHLLYRHHELLAGERSLFLRYYGELLHLDASEQIAMRRVLEAFLSRVEWDDKHLPIRLFPFFRGVESERRAVVIDPQVSFGRPILARSGIGTAALVQRIDATTTSPPRTSRRRSSSKRPRDGWSSSPTATWAATSSPAC
jgi:helix-turn-helix protein